MADDTQNRPLNVLFLCTGNSARSIMAESVLNKMGAGKFRAQSAGSHPKGKVNPEALRLLESLQYDTGGLRSKSWEEFAERGAPEFDFIITVCDDAAGEACPVWPEKPITAHWGIPDPAAVKGAPQEISRAFGEAYRSLAERIAMLVALPIDKLDANTVRSDLKKIGTIKGATVKAKAQ